MDAAGVQYVCYENSLNYAEPSGAARIPRQPECYLMASQSPNANHTCMFYNYTYHATHIHMSIFIWTSNLSI